MAFPTLDNVSTLFTGARFFKHRRSDGLWVYLYKQPDAGYALHLCTMEPPEHGINIDNCHAACDCKNTEVSERDEFETLCIFHAFMDEVPLSETVDGR